MKGLWLDILMGLVVVAAYVVVYLALASILDKR